MNLSSHFVSKTRANGETFYSLNDDAPGWLLSAVRDASRSDISDWLWEACYHAALRIDDGDVIEGDTSHEWADVETEIYTQKLFQWAATHCLTDTWAEAEAEAKELGADKGLSDQISTIQYCALRYIFEVMYNAYTDATEEESEEETFDA